MNEGKKVEINWKKTVVLKCMKTIMSAKQETIEILRRTSAFNMKLIEKQAKSLKDPNPLSSMQAAITTKYPISVSKQKAIDYNIPDEFLSPNFDSHQHDRRLCKLEAIDWFIVNNMKKRQDPSVIDILYKHHRIMRDNYYAYKWETAKVTFGQVTLERARVPTREVAAVIPADKRKSIIINALMPELSRDFTGMDFKSIEQIMDVANLNLHNKMSLMAQLRTLLDSLDERVRVLPLHSNESIEKNMMRYAFCTNNLKVIVERCGEAPQRLTSRIGEIIDLIGKAVIKSCRKSESLARHLADSILVDGKPIEAVLEMAPEPVSVYSKLVFCLYGLPVCFSNEESGVTLYPEPCDVQKKFESNLVNLRIPMYYGEETVSFKYGEVRGKFVHNGPHINSITMVRCPPMRLRTILVAIARYCRWNFNVTNSKDRNKAMKEIGEKAMNAPSILLRATVEDTERILSADSNLNRAGILSFVEESEVGDQQRTTVRFTDNTLVAETGQTAWIQAPRYDVVFTPDINTDHPDLIDFLPRERMLLKKLHFYASNCLQIQKKVTGGDFNWKNDIISKGLPASDKNHIAAQARKLLRLLLVRGEEASALVIAVLYMFSNGDDSCNNMRNPFLGRFYCYGVEFTLSFDAGFVMIKDGVVHVNGVPESEPLSTDLPRYLVKMFLPNFIVRVADGCHHSVRNLTFLMSNKIRDGETYHLLKDGITYCVTRDHNEAINFRRTLERGYRNDVRVGEEDNLLEVIIGKRVGEALENPSKRFRITVDDDSSDEGEMQDELNSSMNQAGEDFEDIFL